MKEGLKFLAGVGLAALLLWLVLRGVEPGVMWAAVKQASVVGLVLAAVLNVGHNIFRVWRWRALLEPVRPAVHFRPMFVAVIIGYMTSWVVPGRLGELVRPTLLSAREDVPLGPCLGTVVADRLLDGATLVLLFAVGSWLSPLHGEAAEHAAAIRYSSLLLVVVVAVILTLLLVFSAWQSELERWVTGRGRLTRRAVRMWLSFSDGVRALRSPRLLVRVGVYSLLAWLTIALGTWIGVLASGARVSFGAMLVILPMLALGVAVPTPGGAGSYHGAMKLGLMLFGVTEVPAVSAGLLMHAAITIPVILLGVVLVWIERLSWKDLIAAARRIRGLGAESGQPAEEPLGELS